MPIRITRNENGNCITFVGSSQPAYWNSCLSAEVNEEDSNRVNVVNDIRTTNAESPVYEFYAVPYTEFRDKDGGSFADSATAAAYITAQANVSTNGILQFGATDGINFSRDNTNTSILVSTGNSYSVNSISAVGLADGTISIKQKVASGTDIMVGIRPNYVTIEGQSQVKTLTSVVNSLNALFSATPVGSGVEDIFSSYTYSSGSSTMAHFGDVSFVISFGQPIALKNTNTGSSLNDGIYSTTRPVKDNGEYFDFDNTGHDAKRKFVIGLKLTSEITDSTVFSTNTEAGEGMALAVRLKPNTSYEHSPYGAVIENGFYARPQASSKYRAGIDSDGRLFISHFEEEAQEWQVIVRSAFPSGGEEYSLVIFLNEDSARCSNVVSTNKITDGSVTLNYRYIESPNGSFYYPLFSSQEEANYLDELRGGAGTSHTHVFADELPTANAWYMPSTGGSHDAIEAPSNTDLVTYSGVSTGADADFVPADFAIANQTGNESTVVNLQINPTSSSYTTTITGLPSGLTVSGNYLVGTLPPVTGSLSTNPTDVYTFTITRTNSYGNSTQDFNYTVVNTTIDTTPISGFTGADGSVEMVDPNTLNGGSALIIDNIIEDGKRFNINEEFVTANVLPALQTAGDYVYVGFKRDDAAWDSISLEDFELGFRFGYSSATAYTVTRGGNGTAQPSITHTVTSTSPNSIGFDFYLSNEVGVLEANAHSSSESRDGERSVANGGIFTFSSSTDTGVTKSRSIVVALEVGASTNMTITESNLSEYTMPVPPVSPTPIIGLTHVTGSTFMVDDNTLGAGSAISFDNLLEDGNRFHISKEFVDANIVTGLFNVGDMAFIGIPATGADFSTTITKSQFDICWVFERITSSAFKIYRTGATLSNTSSNFGVSSGSLLYDFYISNQGGVLELTGDQHQFVKDNEFSLADGGTWSLSKVLTGQAVESKTIVMAAMYCTPDISLNNLFEYALPVQSVSPTPITGLNHIEGSTFMVDDNTLGDGSAVALDSLLEDGNRLHISDEFVASVIIPGLPNAGDTLYIGIPVASPNWGSVSKDDFVLCWKFQKDTQGNRFKIYRTGYGLSDSYGIWLVSRGSLLYDFYISNQNGVLELTGDQYQYAKDNEFSLADGGTWSQSRVLAGQAAESKTIVIAAVSCTPDITMSNLTEYPLPVPTPTNATSWTKAVQFTPTGEILEQSHVDNSLNAIRMGGQGQTVNANYVDPTWTTNAHQGRPWATTIVFKPGFQTGGQYVWNSGGGSANNKDNIAVRTSSNYLYFSWGRDGYQSICLIESSLPREEWYGLYIAFKGQKYSGTTNSSANMADAFDIRLMSSADNFASVGANKSTAAAWVSTSNMGRGYAGAFTVGGQGTAKSYEGKIASMVVTTLKQNSALPDDVQIKSMITDPTTWVTDYKVGDSYRQGHSNVNVTNFQIGSYHSYSATQVWLMGDGTTDSFTNGVRNLINPNDNSYTKLTFNNMVSNDIETVSIPGLS